VYPKLFHVDYCYEVISGESQLQLIGAGFDLCAVVLELAFVLIHLPGFLFLGAMSYTFGLAAKRVFYNVAWNRTSPIVETVMPLIAAGVCGVMSLAIGAVVLAVICQLTSYCWDRASQFAAGPPVGEPIRYAHRK